MTRGRNWSRPPCRAPDFDRSRRQRLEAPPPGYFTSLIIQIQAGGMRGPTIPRNGRCKKDGPRVNHAPLSAPPGPPPAATEPEAEPTRSEPIEESADAARIENASVGEDYVGPESGTRDAIGATGTEG